MVFLLIAACSKAPPPPPPSFPVHLGQSIEKASPIFIEALAHVDPINSVQILSRIEGELMNVYFTEGKEVKSGDLLFTIDPRPYEAALKSAQAVLAQSTAALKIADEKVKRYAQLTRDEYYSVINYETLQTNYETALALVQQNQAQVDAAALNLEYCWIYAPIDGVTGILQITKGNLIANDGTTPLISVNQLAPIYVTISIPEIRLVDVQQAAQTGPVKIISAFENFKGKVYEGELQMFDNAVDPSTGMIKLRGIFPNEDRALWPGQFIRSRVILKILQNAVIVPYTAIQQTLSGPIIYVLKEGETVESRKVKLGQREDDNIVILEGIKAGEKIVIEGQLNLFDGAHVHLAGAAAS